MIGTTLLDRAKGFLRARSPAAQVAEIGDEIKAVEAELARIAEERQRWIVPRLTGDLRASNLIDELDRDAEALRRRLVDLRQAQSQVAATIAAEQQAARETAFARALPADMAAKRKHIFDLAVRLDHTADEMAAAFKTIVDAFGELAQITGTGDLQRCAAVLPSQIRNGLTPRFDIDPTGPKRRENNLLHLV